MSLVPAIMNSLKGTAEGTQGIVFLKLEGCDRGAHNGIPERTDLRNLTENGNRFTPCGAGLRELVVESKDYYANSRLRLWAHERQGACAASVGSGRQERQKLNASGADLRLHLLSITANVEPVSRVAVRGRRELSAWLIASSVANSISVCLASATSA